MLKRTNAFIVLKEHTQAILDYSVLVCTAVPQLEHAFKEHEKDESVYLAKNIEFRESHQPYSTEKRTIETYKDVQGANLFLSSFSFFESYFFALIEEMVEFHGGEEQILKFVRKQLTRQPTLSLQEQSNLAKLGKPFKKNHSDRFRKFTSALDTSKIIWPTQKFALYGLEQIFTNRKRWKSVDIPDLITDLLLYDLDETDRSKFHTLRDNRNKIAHGKSLKYDLNKAIDANHFFYSLAAKLDTHTIKNYFIVERFR
jgi:hypothetical protein